ncbi:MAG: NAD(+)/NADH kinase [Phycisphaerales bacterium]
MGRSVVLLVNRAKGEAARAGDEVAELVRAHGTLVATLDSEDPAAAASVGEADLLVVLGGDGTLLAAARQHARGDTPLLGVNIGKVGFMAGFEMESIRRHARAVFGGAPLTTHAVSMLRAQVVDEHGHEGEQLEAVNEFVVTAGPPYRMITLAMSIDGNAGPQVRGDGLIVATPTGSTAYNVSAGGPIVAPMVGATVITPIAAHSLAFRPIVLGERQVVEVTVVEANEENGGGTTLVADGQERRRVRVGERVRIQGGGRRIEFVVDPEVSYWRTLMRKMGWAAPPRG